MIDYNELAAREAKNLIRYAIGEGWALKPPDAIHLASAMRFRLADKKVTEFNSYDGGMKKNSPR